VASKDFKLDLDIFQIGEVASQKMQDKIQTLKERIDSVRAKNNHCMSNNEEKPPT
jgi:hypothetical protein